jgi:hypothetical protein
MVGLLWAQESSSKAEHTFSDVSATSWLSYADAEFPSPSRFSLSVEINGAGEDCVAERLPNDQRLELQSFAIVLCMPHQNGTANNLFE